MTKKLMVAVVGMMVGSLAASELELPKEGLVVQVDASKFDSIDFNEANEVVGWHSQVGDVAYTNNLTGDSYQWDDGAGKIWTVSARRPYYSATALKGKPGIMFGYEKDGTTKAVTWLYCNQMVKHGTVFFVCEPDSIGARYDSSRGIMGALRNYRTLVQVQIPSGSSYPCAWNFDLANYPGGRGYINGQKVFDYNEGLTDNPVRFCEDGVRLAHVMGLVLYDDYIKWGQGYALNQVAIGAAYLHREYAFQGPVSEIVVYNRQLTDEEAVKVSQMLAFKWLNGPTLPARWVGKGETAAWSDPDNWEDGEVPAAGAPIIASNATITVDGSVEAGELALFGSVDITIAEGAEFSHAAMSVCSDAAADFTISGSGSLVMTGSGTKLLPADLAVKNLKVCDGVLDLNGHSVSCVDLTGDGVLDNMSDTSSTIAVSGKLTTYVRGNVSVRFTGEGDKELLAYNAYTGATVLDGGKLTTVTNIAPGSIEGLVMHVDASLSETITTNADGEVVSWRSTLNDGFAFNSIHDPAETRYSTHAPYLTTDPATGLPAVLFGRVKDLSSSTGAVLNANMPIEHRTLVFVANILSKTTVGTESSAPFGSFRQIYGCTTKNASGLTASSGTQQRYSAYSYALHERGRAWVNGRYLWNWTNCVGKTAVDWGKVTDPDTQYSPDTTDFSLNWNGTKSGSWGYSHVIVSVADTNSYTYVPALGTGQLGSDKFQAGYVSEALVYNRVLTDEEIMRISAAMMEKWQIKQSDESGFIKAENTYPVGSPLVVTADSTLDLHNIPQEIGSLKVDAGEGSLYPSLVLAGIPGALFNLTDMTLTVASDGDIAKGRTVLSAPGAQLTGPFASVEPSGTAVRYRDDSVRILAGGLVIMFR